MFRKEWSAAFWNPESPLWYTEAEKNSNGDSCHEKIRIPLSIHRLRRRGGRTAVVVTHDAEEAKALGARIFTLPMLREEGARA